MEKIYLERLAVDVEKELKTDIEKISPKDRDKLCQIFETTEDGLKEIQEKIATKTNINWSDEPTRLKAQLRAITRGLYDIQKMRIQAGNRVVANFKYKLGQEPSTSETKMDKESQNLLKQIREEFIKITDGIVVSNLKKKNKKFKETGTNNTSVDELLKAAETELEIVGEDTPRGSTIKQENLIVNAKKINYEKDGLINNITEFTLVKSYLSLVQAEEENEKLLKEILKLFPIYSQYLINVKGTGPKMSSVIISEIDIVKAKYSSSIMKYMGIDVVNGKGRSQKKDHLIVRPYIDKDQHLAIKKSITYNPFLKSKMMGVLADVFVKLNATYHQIYIDYKTRLENHEVYSKVKPAHRHRMALRYMMKMFVIDLYVNWKKIEGLPAMPSYQEAKLGHVHNS